MPVDGAMMWPLGKGPSTPASPQRSESSVTVRFENAPPGMRVRQTRTDGRTSLDTVIERGYAVSVP